MKYEVGVPTSGFVQLTFGVRPTLSGFWYPSLPPTVIAVTGVTIGTTGLVAEGNSWVSTPITASIDGPICWSSPGTARDTGNDITNLFTTQSAGNGLVTGNDQLRSVVSVPSALGSRLRTSGGTARSTPL